tara:strand:- start:3476 stop:4954 length:1479 start_codon:yes stop_codon:yes gene_type:complete
MALVWEQYPVKDAAKVPVITNWTPLIGYMLFRNDTNYLNTLFYYQLVLEVYTGTSVVAANIIASIRQRRNGYSDDVANGKARAYFDLRDIANTQLVDTVFDQNDTGDVFRSVHTIGANTAAKPYSQNGDSKLPKTQICSLTVKGFENYSSAANTSPTDQTDNVTDTQHYTQASLPLFTPRSVIGGSVDTTFLQGDNFNVYAPDSGTDKFLSDVESSTGDYNLSGYLNYVQDTDYHTVAFLNDATEFASDLFTMLIKYYDSDNSIIGSAQGIDNVGGVSGYGGAKPNTVSTDAERLIYFGCGPANLQAQSATPGANPSNFTDWAYYTIQGINASISTTTALYYFIKEDGSCKGYKVRRLAFRNSLGCYDYLNFKRKSTQTVDVQRNTYSSLIGRYNASKFIYNDTQRGKDTRQVTAGLKETLNTDWLSEEQANLVEKLIMSTSVYMVENADTTYTQGVMVTNSTHIRKTVANDKVKIQYTINIEYANPLNTNS